MPHVILQFKNVFHLLEYIEITGQYQASADTRKLTIQSEFTDAEIELAINGFQAAVMSDAV